MRYLTIEADGKEDVVPAIEVDGKEDRVVSIRAINRRTAWQY